MKTHDVTRMVADAWIAELRQIHETSTGAARDVRIHEHARCLNADLFDLNAIRTACREQLEQELQRINFDLLLLEQDLPSDNSN